MSVPEYVLEKGINLNPIQDAIEDIRNDLELIALKLKARVEIEDPNGTEQYEDSDQEEIIGDQLFNYNFYCSKSLTDQLDMIVKQLSILYSVRRPICMDCKHKTLGSCSGEECGDLEWMPVKSLFAIPNKH